jgi:beta-galactosidase
VFVSTTPAGSHAGGYDAFEIDLTAALPAQSEEIPLAIRCSNARDFDLIPSDLNDFTLHGGIYRPLELAYFPAISLSHCGIRTTVTGDCGKLSLDLELRNPAGLVDEVSWNIKVFGPDGGVLDERKGCAPAWTGGKKLPEISLAGVTRWRVENPVLYRILVVLESRHGQTSAEKRIGFRDFDFHEHGPFYLNGSRLLLRGTQRHEDHAGVGASMTAEQIAAEMRMIKAMGANFIRLGHYQQNEQVLDLCDELGLIVYEEIPWCRGGLGGETYQEHARSMLRGMIRQHSHHPSVVFWGLGNENDWPGDFEEFDQARISRFMAELHGLAKELDPDRLTSIRRCEFCSGIVDAYSPSIWVGWYRGNYREYSEEIESATRKYPRWLHIEWGADCHAGRHAEEPDCGVSTVLSSDGGDERAGDFLRYGGDLRVSRDGDWSETYCCDLIDWHLGVQESSSGFPGSAHWLFKDFSTPLRPDNPIPFVNQKGVVQRNLEPKEGYYVFQSHWATEPMLRLYGHGWNHRWGGEGEARRVRVYSNCPSVEVFLNGVSLGAKDRRPGDFPCSGLRWDTPFQNGPNCLEAVARLPNGAVLRDSIRFTYHSTFGIKAARIQLTGQDIGGAVRLEATLVDAEGLPCLTARDVLNCEVLGEVLQSPEMGVMGGASQCEAANGRAFWNVQVTGAPAFAVVRSAGLPPTYFSLRA